MSRRVETSTPPNTPAPIGPYSHIAKVGSFITIGGTAGVDPLSGELAGADVLSQTKRILESFRVMLESVGSDSPPRLAAMRGAVARGDAPALASAAHFIKSSVGVFSKGGVFEAARAIEIQGRESDLRGAPKSLARFESEMAQLTESLSLAKRLSSPSRSRQKKSAKKKARKR